MTRDMVFLKENGMRIKGKLYLPEGKKRKWPLVIFAHGFGGCCRELMHHGDGFAEAGICCLFFDFCGGGIQSLSDGQMADMTVASECDDLKTVISQAKALDDIDSERIYLLGESMGGLVAALTAAECPDEIAAMVLWYPAFIIPEDAEKRMQTGDHRVFGLPMEKRFDQEAARIPIYQILPGYQKPILILHGDKDCIVPLRYSMNALRGWLNAELIVMQGAGHGYEGPDSVAAREHSIAFLTKHLPDSMKSQSFS